MNRRTAHRSNTVRQRRNRKRPNWFKIILNVLLLAVAAELIFLAFTSPRLRVNHVEVRGVRTIRASDIRSCAQSALGSNIFLADTRKVRRIVMKNPVVRTARVRKWPASKLIIRVEERVPVAIVSHNGGSYLTDNDGVIYSRTSRPSGDMPVLEVSTGKTLQPGTKTRLRPVRLALNCLKQARENDLTVEKISVDPRSNICLNMRSGLQIRLGPPVDIDKKLSILHGVLAAKPDFASDAVYLDLSCTAAPAWKSKGTAPFSSTL